MTNVSPSRALLTLGGNIHGAGRDRTRSLAQARLKLTSMTPAVGRRRPRVADPSLLSASTRVFDSTHVGGRGGAGSLGLDHPRVSRCPQGSLGSTRIPTHRGSFGSFFGSLESPVRETVSDQRFSVFASKSSEPIQTTPVSRR